MEQKNREIVKEEETMEAATGYRRFMTMRVPNLQETIESIENRRIMSEEEAADDYRVYGKFLVKETFEGDNSLTDLLTEYIERTTKLKY